ncbi:MAG TPA: hypothetical protein VNX26_03620 [Candidatus Acidoferrum sp.]|jgi:hypothetical protein|nr:hypothetical protein [Candidatus Acidoferrum sp.]
MLTGRKLALTLAFTVLVALAFGVSCTGFFPKNTLSAISIQPPSPQIQVGAANAQTLQAWGTFSDNSRSQITSGVQWTSSDSTVLQIGPTTGVATGEGTGGTATVTAAAQGLSTTATATVFLGNITGFQVCMGTFGATTTCSNGSSRLTWNVNAQNSVIQTFVAQGTANGTTLDFTTASTWTVSSAAGSSITCTNSGASPETCTVAQLTTAGTYTITVVYGTGSSTSSATIDAIVTN